MDHIQVIRSNDARHIERKVEWSRRIRRVVGPTKNELSVPSILFFLAAITLPLASMVVSWVLFGLSLACLDDSTDVNAGGDCRICIDCNLDGTPSQAKEAQMIGTFCRYPAFNVTTDPKLKYPASDCTVGSAIIMGFAAPGVVISIIALIIAILLALTSIVGSCKLARSSNSSEIVSQWTVARGTGAAAEAKNTERRCCRTRPRLPKVDGRKRCCGGCGAKAAEAAAALAAEAETAAAAERRSGTTTSDVGSGESPTKSAHTPLSLGSPRSRRALNSAFTAQPRLHEARAN